MRNCILLLTVFLSVLYMPRLALGSEYSPDNFYDPEYYQLENSMEVILRQRDVNHNVSIRLAVGLGDYDFECGLQELPHFLEHLLFTGTSGHSETELDALISDNGGYWNATTRERNTVYEIDIYSKSVFLALDTLFEIMHDSQMTPENVETTRDILRREMGGSPSKLRQYLYARGIGRDAHTESWLELFPDSRIICPQLETVDDITREDIVAAYRDYYVPNNMALVVVGEFDPGAVREKIQETFGTLPGSPVAQYGPLIPERKSKGPRRFTGAMSDPIGSDMKLMHIYRTEGYLSPDYYVLNVIEQYLYSRLFDRIRVEKGLAYSPDASVYAEQEFGVFTISADIHAGNERIVEEIMRDEAEQLINGFYDEDTLASIQKSILLKGALGYDSNASVAEYYVDRYEDLSREGGLINYEDMIEQVTGEDVVRVARKYFTGDNLYVVRQVSVMSFTQLVIVIALFLFATAVVFWRYVKRLRRRISGKIDG